MSVIKNKRSLSDLEFYHNAVKLRREITLLLLRDFGVKDRIRELKPVTKDMEAADAEIYEKLTEKYGGLLVINEYPKWLIDRMRDAVMDIMHDMIMNITQANTIYPAHESEYYERRNYQNRAIGNCEQLLQELQYILSVIPVDINKYAHYVTMIEREIALLKGWRKNDNKILARIRGESN